MKRILEIPESIVKEYFIHETGGLNQLTFVEAEITIYTKYKNSDKILGLINDEVRILWHGKDWMLQKKVTEETILKSGSIASTKSRAVTVDIMVCIHLVQIASIAKEIK